MFHLSMLRRSSSSHRRGRVLATVIALTAMLAVAAIGSSAPSAAASTTWNDTVGAQTADKGVQALAFLPNEIWIDSGDSIAWHFNSDEPHTVALAAPDGTSAFMPQTCNGAASSTNSCAWNGTGLVTSALQEEGATFTVSFSTTGNFAFRCLLHKNMSGTIHVQASGAIYPHDQAFYDRQGTEQANRLLERGREIIARNRDRAGDDDHGDSRHDNGESVIVGNVEPVITTSGGLQSVFTPRFERPDIRIHVGDTVSWKAPDALTPHTVTFGEEPSNFIPPVALQGPGEATTLSTPYPTLKQGTTVSSGALGDSNPAWNGSSFKVTFNTAGTYQYYCAVHDDLGMVGTIHVDARDNQHHDNDNQEHGDNNNQGNDNSGNDHRGRD